MTEQSEVTETKLPRGARRKMETRHRLVEAAKTVMAKSSIEGAAIADITEEADVGFGSFYNHFATKIDIATAALQSELERLQLDKQADQTAAGSIVSFVRTVVAQAGREPTLAAFQAQAFNSISGLTNPFVERLREIVRTGSQSEEFQIADVDLTSEMVAAMVFGTVRHILATGERKTAETSLLEGVLRVLGVSPDPAEKLLGGVSAAKRARKGRSVP